MYEALKDLFRELDRDDGICLSISHSVPLAEVLGLNKSRIVQANYPEHTILDLQFESGTFDFCISDQVFEHIEGSPFAAFAETVRVLKPGGRICHTTCFINEIHGAPSDYWRFTPEGLALMARSCGLTGIVVGGWGNREVVELLRTAFRNIPIPFNRDSPIYKMATRNEPDWPIVVWVVAEKPI